MTAFIKSLILFKYDLHGGRVYDIVEANLGPN